MTTPKGSNRLHTPGISEPIDDYPEIMIPGLLEKTAALHPDRPAFLFEENVISYNQLLTMSLNMAASLGRLGIKKGDRVALFMNNCPQFVISIFAISRIGGIIVNNISPMYVVRELESIFLKNDVDAVIVEPTLWKGLEPFIEKLPIRLAVFSDQLDLARPVLPGRSYDIPDTKIQAVHFLELIGETAPEIKPDQWSYPEPDDIAFFQLTGGTTGHPKAAILTHRNLIANVTQAKAYLGELGRSWQVLLPNMPFSHIYGVTCGVLNACASGWTTLIMTRFSVTDTLAYLSRYPVTILNSVPIIFSGLIEHLEKDSHLESCFSYLKMAGCGSAPLPESIFQRFRELTGVELCQGYGLTESSPVVCSTPVLGVKKAGSVGLPYPGVQVKIVDPSNHLVEMKTGASGELLVKGPQVMRGYYKNPEATQKALSGGYLHTGDIAFIDGDGYVYLIGRKERLMMLTQSLLKPPSGCRRAGNSKRDAFS